MAEVDPEGACGAPVEAAPLDGPTSTGDVNRDAAHLVSSESAYAPELPFIEWCGGDGGTELALCWPCEE